MNQPRCSETLLAPPALPCAAPGAREGPPAPCERAGQAAAAAPCASHVASPRPAGSRDRGDRTEEGKEIFLHYPPLWHELMAKRQWDRGPGVMAAPVGRAGVTSKR